MNLILSPVRMDTTLTASVVNDVLTLNDEVLDFNPLPVGATLPASAIDSQWVVGDVERDMDGVLTVTLIVPHGSKAPQQTLFPTPIEVFEGPIPLPPHSLVEEVFDAEY